MTASGGGVERYLIHTNLHLPFSCMSALAIQLLAFIGWIIGLGISSDASIVG